MRAFLMAAVAVAASASIPAHSAPAAPQVTAGAGLKAIRLDWNAVSGVSRYEVWYRAHATSAYVKSANYLPATTSASFRIAVHSFDWPGARYRVDACSSAGCTSSREIPVVDLRLDAPGYFKASQPEVAADFGGDVDVSPDGAYFVAAAPNDDASGVGGAGAAYVFRRSGSGWTQRTRLVPAALRANGGAGLRVAISADGSTVAMGLPRVDSGEVYVFHYTGTSWQRTRIETTTRGAFGAWVSLDDAGKVLAVGRDTGADRFVLLANGTWGVSRHIEDRTAPVDHCVNGELSGDGRLLAEQCYNGSATAPSRVYLRVHSSYASARRDVELPRPSGATNDEQRFGLAVDFTGDTLAAQNFNGRTEVEIFERISGWHTWTQKVTPGSWQAGKRTLFGQGLALSSNGHVLAVGDPLDVAQGTGVQRGTLTAGSTATGGVYVFNRSSSGAWSRASVVKPNYPAGAAQTFGVSLSLSESGSTLLVGEPLESSDAAGVDGAWNNTRRSQSGAVWLY